MRMMRKLIFLNLVLFIVLINAYPQIAQFRGPYRNGNFEDTQLKKFWPENGPSVLLKLDGLGQGHSSPVVHNNIIYLSGKKDSLDVLTAYDFTGRQLWSEAFGAAWYASYSDTRSTPTIENERIYISSGMGEVVCMDTKTGKIIWKKDPHSEFKGAFGSWGTAESVLLTDKAVIASVGGKEASVVALDKENGNFLWKSSPTKDKRAYVSPLLIERNGQEIILIVLSDNIMGINPQNGEIFWTYDLRECPSCPDGKSYRRNNTNTPLYKNGEIFFTCGYDTPAVMLSLSEDGRSVKLKWQNDVLDTHHGGVVEVGGYIYGSNWMSNSDGKWVCLEWETGKVMYETEWINKGQIIYADGNLYCKEEKTGHIALVPATPSGFNITSSFRPEQKPGPYWSHPVIYDGKLLVRQNGELMVYDIRNN